MANRTYNQFQGTLLKGVVTLYAKLDFDGSGNCTVVTSEVINAASSPVTINPSNGFVGEVVAPTGGSGNEYILKLQDPYVRLLMVASVGLNSTNGGGAIVVLDDVNNQTDPTLTLAFGPGALTSTTVLLAVDLSNSTAL